MLRAPLLLLAGIATGCMLTASLEAYLLPLCAWSSDRRVVRLAAVR